VQAAEYRRRSEDVETNLEFWITTARMFAIAAALGAFAWALRRQRREFSGQLDQVLAAQQQARAESQVLADRVSVLATLIAAMPARVERPVEAPPPMQRSRRESSSVRSYETARRLARSGASVEEIVATCGLADTEARLLQRLLGANARRDDAA
jgi:hypothetical protein